VARPQVLEAAADGFVALNPRIAHRTGSPHDALRVEDDEPVLDALDDGLDEVDARSLDRDRGLAGERFEELALVEREPRARDAHRDDADGATHRAERDVEPLAPGSVSVPRPAG
jgi:hypothetical protein